MMFGTVLNFYTNGRKLKSNREYSMQSKDEEDFEGMSDYDNGRAAPEDYDRDRAPGFEDDDLDEEDTGVDFDWDDDQYPDNGEDDD